MKVAKSGQQDRLDHLVLGENVASLENVEFLAGKAFRVAQVLSVRRGDRDELARRAQGEELERLAVQAYLDPKVLKDSMERPVCREPPAQEV